MDTQSSPEILDQIVAEYSDRVSRGGQVDASDLLARVPAEHRDALARCLRMVHSGLATAPRTVRALVPGTVLGNYRLVREIGRGGMSIVFLAQQIDLQRPVALKVLRPGLAIEPQHVERFRREALSIARLQHPHIVQVHAVGETDGWNWIAMEYVEGKNLAQVYDELSKSQPDPRQRTADSLAKVAGERCVPARDSTYAAALCALLAPVARAISVAHEIGLVHRDVKPSNILIHKDGRALIADFGLAKGDGDPGLSLTGEPIGTPYYMSPEQAQMSQIRVDRRTDVYSLGVTLYEGLAGRRPFEGDSLMHVLDAIRSQSPLPLRRHLNRVDSGVEAVVDVAMSPRAEDRYSDAFELASDLESFVRGDATRAAGKRGGEWAAFRRALSSAQRHSAIEYRSRGEFLGVPWVHLHYGQRARGWIAVGNDARGFLAFGGRAVGVFSCGGLAAGGFAFGGLACGLATFGGLAAGLLAYGGVACGYASMGGAVVGRYAAGGTAYGQYVVSPDRRDPEAVRFFNENLSFVSGPLEPRRLRGP